MPFPNPRVLTSFLREYLEYRQTTTWHTTTGILASFIRNDQYYKTGQCTEINRRFYNTEKLKTLDGWIELIYSLGEEGRKPGLYALTIQAIRNFIVLTLIASEEYKEDFLERRATLRQEVDKLNDDIMIDMKAKLSKKDVSIKEKRYFNNLLKLADLNEENAIFEAERYRLFHKLEYPDLKDNNLSSFQDLNDNIPLCYHAQFCHIFYDKYLRPIPKWNVKFEDFIEKSTTLSTEISEPKQMPVEKTTSVVSRHLFDGLRSYLFQSKQEEASQQIDNHIKKIETQNNHNN